MSLLTQKPVLQQILKKVTLLMEDTFQVQQQLLELFAQQKEILSSKDPTKAAVNFPQEEKLVERLRTCLGHRQRLLQQAQEQGVVAKTLGEFLEAIGLSSEDTLYSKLNECREQAAVLQQSTWSRWIFTRAAFDSYRNRLVALCNQDQNTHKDDLHDTDAALPAGGLLNASA